MRVIAALAVLFSHMEQDGLYMAWIPLHFFSHEAVIGFFVLSGYVIAHSTFDREKSWQAFAMARIIRVYSVALPAILLSLLAAVALGQGISAWDAVSSILFLNESWTNPASVPMNAPYWSLCYEVWYYLLFGLAVFLPHRLRWLCLVIAVLAGPAILLLMPIWLLGVGLARWPMLSWTSPVNAVAAATIGLAAIVAVDHWGFAALVRGMLEEKLPGFWLLASSERFITDYVVALAFGLHLVGIRSIIEHFEHAIALIERPIRFFASCSFSIYLIHKPMTEVIGRVWSNESESIPASLVAFAIIFGMCILFANLTEHRVKAWRSSILSNLFRPQIR